MRRIRPGIGKVHRASIGGFAFPALRVRSWEHFTLLNSGRLTLHLNRGEPAAGSSSRSKCLLGCLSCRYESLQVATHLQKPIRRKFWLFEPRYVADEFRDGQDLDVRVFWYGGELAVTGDDAPYSHLAKLSPKLVVAQVGSSLCLVKGVLRVARFIELPTPSFCLNREYSSWSHNKVL